MCGIAYAHNFDGTSVNNEILQRFDEQRHRGTQGFGLFDGSKGHIVRATKENKILKWLCRYDSNLILFHHRYPSPSAVENIKAGAHPYSTGDYYGDYQYILIHNGGVLNDWDLLQDHEDMGIKYRSLQKDYKFNDSESLLWDFASKIENNENSLKAYGAIAFMCIRLYKGELDKLYFGRNDRNPLVLQRDKNSIVISSEGEGDMINENTLYTWNYKLKRLTKKDFFIPRYLSDGKQYEYDNQYHFKGDTAGDTPTCATNDLITDEDLAWIHQKQTALGLSKDNQIKPVGTLSDDEIIEEMEKFTPPANQIQALAMDYMNMSNGHFESAYTAMESEYIEQESNAKYLSDYKSLRLLELAIILLECDDEYVDSDSVSSYWIKGGAFEPLRLSATSSH